MESLFILDSDGKILIEKQWKQPIIPRSVISCLFQEPHHTPSTAIVKPILTDSTESPPSSGESLDPPRPSILVKSSSKTSSTTRIQPYTLIEEKYHALTLQESSLYFVSVLTSERQPLAVFAFLRRVIQLLLDYFGGLSENLLKEHFVIVYELLEEMIDNGHPYITEPCILKDMIPPPSLLSSVINAVSLGTTFGTKVPSGTVSTVPWRASGIKYTSNEIFFDVVEEWQVVMNRQCQTIGGSVWGQVDVNCRLSGMPDVIVAFENKKLLDKESVALHPCVRYQRFERETLLSFIPPDGSFTVMEYNLDVIPRSTVGFGSVGETLSCPLILKASITSRGLNQVKLDLSVEPRYLGSGKRSHRNSIRELPSTFTPATTSSSTASSRDPQQLSNVVVTVKLLPEKTNTPSQIQSSVGSTGFDSIQSLLTWTVPSLDSLGMCSMTISTSTSTSVSKLQQQLQCLSSISATFQSNMSLLSLGSVSVQSETYTPFKGVLGRSRGQVEIQL